MTGFWCWLLRFNLFFGVRGCEARIPDTKSGDLRQDSNDLVQYMANL